MRKGGGGRRRVEVEAFRGDGDGLQTPLSPLPPPLPPAPVALGSEAAASLYAASLEDGLRIPLQPPPALEPPDDDFLDPDLDLDIDGVELDVGVSTKDTSLPPFNPS
jgi:hypothetical protein